MRAMLVKFLWLLSAQFGLDPLRFARSVRALPSFVIDYFRFRKVHKGKIILLPCLHDRYEEGGTTKNEYFWQDFLVARWVHEAAPNKHVDIGSRVDGFVAHVASFREIEVFDVRPISTVIPGIIFRQANLMDAKSLPTPSMEGYCDSLSCLHALEHFGLGRYGDPIEPQGFVLGLENMAKLLQPSGLFYLSTPIGSERVEFNANWVFDPRTILQVATDNALSLKKLTVFNHVNGVREMDISSETFTQLAVESYNLGIFIFQKNAS